MTDSTPATAARKAQHRRAQRSHIDGWWRRVWLPAVHDSLRLHRHAFGSRWWPLRVLPHRLLACRAHQWTSYGWTCQRLWLHGGAHRFRNYVWFDNHAEEAQVQYDPLPSAGHSVAATAATVHACQDPRGEQRPPGFCAACGDETLRDSRDWWKSEWEYKSREAEGLWLALVVLAVLCGRLHGLDPLAATRPHIELFSRMMEEQRYERTTHSKYVSVVCLFYKFCLIDGYISVGDE